MTWSIQPVWPLWLIAMAGAALLAATFKGSLILRARNVTPVWIGRLAMLRILAACLILLCLLRPGLQYSRKADARPDRLILVDTSASMSLPDAGGSTRIESALRRLRAPRLRAALLDAFDNHWIAFDAHIRPLEEADPRTLRANGTDTRIGEAIEQAYDWWRWSSEDPDAEKPPPRVLLVSDGLDRGRRDALDTILKLGLTVDVLAPEAAPEASAPKMEIPDVQHTRRLLLGSELRVHATVRQTGMDGVPARLVLETEGRAVMAHKLRFSGNQSEQRLTFGTRPDGAGLHRYALRLETDAAEHQPALNEAEHREIVVRVESRHHEVLVIEPEWRWEFRYLRRVLESDPGFAFSGFLSRGPGVFIQFGEPHRRVSLAGFPRSQAELEGFDTVILGDVNPAHLPPALPEALYNLVAQQGKALVVIAGPDIGTWSRHPRLAALLPVELYPSSSGHLEGPVPLRIGTEGLASPFFFAPDGAPSVRQWPELPPMDQIYAPLRKKPAATVLLETPAHRNDFGPLIVAAVHAIGRGQVLYLATDTLWKWQMQGVMDADGNTPYRVFWQQAMRAIRPERLSASPVNVWLHTDRTQARAGQSVTVYARMDGDASAQNLELDGQMQMPDGRTLPLQFTRDTEAPDRFRSRFEGSEPGIYEIRAEVLSGGQSLGQALAAVSITEMPDETAPLAPNRAYLERLAAGSGGVMADPARPETWEGMVHTAPVVTEIRERTVDLWSNLFLIVALTLVLGGDWLIRLMRGYA